MKRTSEYFDLRWIVQCKWPDRHFETICAFNAEAVAQRYAKDCRARAASTPFEYRVLARNGRGQFAVVK